VAKSGLIRGHPFDELTGRYDADDMPDAHAVRPTSAAARWYACESRALRCFQQCPYLLEDVFFRSAAFCASLKLIADFFSTTLIAHERIGSSSILGASRRMPTPISSIFASICRSVVTQLKKGAANVPINAPTVLATNVVVTNLNSIIRPQRGRRHAATLSSFSVPRMTIFGLSSGNGR